MIDRANILRVREAASRQPHKLETLGSTPRPATILVAGAMSGYGWETAATAKYQPVIQ